MRLHAWPPMHGRQVEDLRTESAESAANQRALAEMRAGGATSTIGFGAASTQATAGAAGPATHAETAAEAASAFPPATAAAPINDLSSLVRKRKPAPADQQPTVDSKRPKE